MSKNLETIYVELDALLDTRLSTLACVSEELAATVLTQDITLEKTISLKGALSCIRKKVSKSCTNNVIPLLCLKADRRTS